MHNTYLENAFRPLDNIPILAVRSRLVFRIIHRRLTRSLKSIGGVDSAKT